MPELADLSAVFGLSHRLFDEYEAAEEDTPPTAGAIKATGKDEELADRLAVWPPVAAFSPGDTILQPGRGAARATLHWFQQVLAHILRCPPPEGDGRRSIAGDAEIENEDLEVEAGGNEPDVKPLSYQLRYWREALGAFDSLAGRFGGLCPDRRQAFRIYAVGTLQFLATMAVHHWILDQQAKGLAEEGKDKTKQVPLASELAQRFLDLFFCSRRQSSDFVPMGTSRYRVGAFPPLAYDLWRGLPERNGWLRPEAVAPVDRIPPHAEFAAVLVLAFAYVKATSGRLPLLQWLLFRLSAFSYIDTHAIDREHLERLFARFFADIREPVAWHDVEYEVGELLECDWPEFDGFRDLRVLNACVSSEAGANRNGDATARFGPLAITFLRSRAAPRFVRVPHGETCCINPNCSSAYQADGSKSALSSYQPVICHSCGVALVPDVLYDAWRGFENEELP
ncbi:MAG: hypothetical protein HN849_11580 [Victivallales bacterium]|nr:hypothetical protein [Victivallales bacterium]